MSQVAVARRSPSPSPERRHTEQRRSPSGGGRDDVTAEEAAATAGGGDGLHLQVPSSDSFERDRRSRRMTELSSALAPPLAQGAARPPRSNGSVGTSDARCSTEQLQHSRYTTAEVEKIRRKLKYHFMTPQEKWKAKRVFPYKLLVQTFKIIIVTFQLVSFGSERTAFVDFTKRSALAMCHMYLEKWDPTYETNPYPAAIGQYALYEKAAFYKHINYALTKYNQTREICLGVVDFPNSDISGQKSNNMKLCKEFFKVGEVNPFNESYNVNPTLTTECIVVEPVVVRGNGTHSETHSYDVAEFLRQKNMSIVFNSLHKLTLEFSLKTIRLKEAGNLDPFDTPICLSITGLITYDNSGHNGQMPVQLTIADLQDLGCQGTTVVVEETSGMSGLILGLDTLSLIVCIVSLYLCSRSLGKASRLRKVAVEFFDSHFQHKLSTKDRFEFVSLWFVMIVISDVLLSVGTSIKIYTRIQGTHSYTICGLILGLSNLLVWMGILRYLGFFKKYNTLLLTIKKAAPDMLRFLVCALVIYSAFLFCGWIVLGPYHVKFATISTTSECLFSLINGDDMFSTFSIIGFDKAPLEVWLFSRAYIYLFSASYIYLVLSLFIAVIMDAYETIKYCLANGFPKSFMEQFIDTCPDPPTSARYLADDEGGNKCSNQARRCLSRAYAACLASCGKCSRTTCRNDGSGGGSRAVGDHSGNDDDQQPMCSGDGAGCSSSSCCLSMRCCLPPPAAAARQTASNALGGCLQGVCSLPTCTVRTASMEDDVEPVIV